MVKPIILLIHGMGTHKPGDILKEFSKGVNAGAQFLGHNRYDLATKAEFHEYNYSDYLDQVRQQGATEHGSIADHIDFLAQLPGFAQSIIQFEANLAGDNMLYTHWLDVVYYGLTLHGARIRTGCKTKIMELAKKAHEEMREFHIVAHSLGTAVAHDAMYHAFKVDLAAGDDNHIDSAVYRVDSYFSVANVSRLLYMLNGVSNPEHSIVHDHQEVQPGCISSFYIARNEFDPFTWFKQYDRQIVRGKFITVNKIRDLGPDEDPRVNPHDLDEYMTNPDICDYFLRFVMHVDITQVQYEQGKAVYDLTTLNSRVTSAVNNTKKQLDIIENVINQIGDANGTPAKIQKLIDLFKQLHNSRDKLKEIVDTATSPASTRTRL